MTIYATLLYSAGMPLLLPVAALNLAIGYASDKYILLRDSARREDRAFAVFFHAAVGTWIFSAVEWTGEDDVLDAVNLNSLQMSAIDRLAILPCALPIALLAVMLVLRLVFTILSLFGGTVMTVLRLVCHKAKCFQRGGCCSLGEQVVESEKSYAEAVEHFEKEGFITTYEPVQNPKYTMLIRLANGGAIAEMASPTPMTPTSPNGNGKAPMTADREEELKAMKNRVEEALSPKTPKPPSDLTDERAAELKAIQDKVFDSLKT